MSTVKRHDEIRSMYVPPSSTQAASDADPCEVRPGYNWIHAYPREPKVQDVETGKWLLRLTCPYVERSWGRIREATEDGLLGVGAKISTEWGNANDPAGRWTSHVVCIYTYDWRDQADVLRVARTLRDIDVVVKVQLNYKPDVFTLAGRYKGNAAGEVTIFKCKAPYESLIIERDNLAQAERAAAVGRG